MKTHHLQLASLDLEIPGYIRERVKYGVSSSCGSHARMRFAFSFEKTPSGKSLTMKKLSCRDCRNQVV